MSLRSAWRSVLGRFRREHRPLRSFNQALDEHGGMGSAIDRGVTTIEVDKIVGSVGRWKVLNSDFLPRTGKALTRRFQRVGEAMRAGKYLPAIDVYKLKPESGARSEYYVLDGHHRVAMARRFGQAFLDAHVIEYRASDAQAAHRLRQVPLFREAAAEDLVAVWRQLAEERIRAGAVICQRGEPGDHFYIVQSGSVDVRLGTGSDGISINCLGPGDCFGEMALLTDEPRSADVVALEDTTLWTLQRSDFDQLVSHNTSLLRAMNRSLVQRVSMLTALVEQARLPPASSGPSGLRFGPYRVMTQIGSGGMSVVYRAAREDDGAVVALKVLPASWGAAPELRERLQREAIVLQRLQHPGVIRLLEVGQVAERLGGGIYIAMEWLPQALDRLLYSRFPSPLATAEALHIADALANALASVHAAGMIHRDVKPSNILLRSDGQPVLTDFGLAAALLDLVGDRRLTPPDTIVGTADYLAPEIIAGHAVDGRADIYALGVVLYEMLATHVPFAGREPFEILRAHLEEPVPELPDEVPAAVRALVMQMLQKDPAHRPASAAELSSAISQLSAGDAG